MLRTEFTEAHRTALDRLAESIFADAVGAIADGRRMDAARVRELTDTGPRTAAEARDVGLVDRLGYRDEAYAAMQERVGADAGLLFADRWRPRRRPRVLARRRRHLALVEARGVIVSGRTRRGATGRQIGADSIGRGVARREERRPCRRGRVARRLPGGSAVASETIWREVCRVRESGKPVVVSMGVAAASGGYFIACPADVIVALPATLTGSIGVFGGKIVVRELFDRVGLNTGTVSHGARSLMFSSRRGFSDDERERLAAIIDGLYDDFVAKVAQGRGRSVAEIDNIARGRVWTGRDALDIGLVDELGGMRDAVRIARARADLPADAPVHAAVRISPWARLGRPKSSADPRAARSVLLPTTADIAAMLGLPTTAAAPNAADQDPLIRGGAISQHCRAARKRSPGWGYGNTETISATLRRVPV